MKNECPRRRDSVFWSTLYFLGLLWYALLPRKKEDRKNKKEKKEKLRANMTAC